MSAITGTEPDHWHDEHGHHRMKDPRTIPGWDWENQTGDWSDPDERAFTTHLVEHERLDETGDPLPDDPPEVRLLLDKIKFDRHVITKQIELVRIMRHQHHHDNNPQEDTGEH